MSTYQYRVLPAPTKGLKAKGVKGPQARFSNAIEDLMNQMGSEGWEYQRAETLPSVERSGLTGSTTEWRNVLVFRKPRADDIATFAPQLLAAPVLTEAEPVETTDNEHPADGEGATKMLSDNGVEELSEVADTTDSLQPPESGHSTSNSDT